MANAPCSMLNASLVCRLWLGLTQALKLAALFTLAASSCADDLKQPPFTIGMLLPPEEAEAQSLREGALFAVEQANNSSNRQVQLVVRGRTGQWGADAVEAARMVTDDGAMGLIAPPDAAATHLALQVAGRTAVPVLSLCPNSSITKTGVPWMARVVPDTIQEVQILMRYFESRIHAPKSLIALVPEDRAGHEITRDLKEACKGTGLTLQKTFELNPTNHLNQSLQRDILRSQAELILVWVDPIPAGQAIKQLRASGYRGFFAGPEHLRSPDLVRLAGTALEGLVIASVALDEDSKSVFAAFDSAFRTRFGHEPNATAAFSYDASNLLIQVLKNSGNEPRRAFPLTFSLNGASGKLSFDAQGNRKPDLRLLVAHHAGFEPLAFGE